MEIKDILDLQAFDVNSYKGEKSKEGLKKAMMKHFSILAVKAEALGCNDLAWAFDVMKFWIRDIIDGKTDCFDDNYKKANNIIVKYRAQYCDDEPE